MKRGDEGEGSAGAGRFERQLLGHGQQRGAAAGSAEGEGPLWDDDAAAKG